MNTHVLSFELDSCMQVWVN